jgi:hypothetical protein
MRTYWLSFAGEEGFRGVCIVEVDEDDAAEAYEFMRERFPHAKPGAEWVMAAEMMAHRMGCNPGGQVLSVEFKTKQQLAMIADHPRNRLLSRAEIAAAEGTAVDVTDHDTLTGGPRPLRRDQVKRV